MSSGLPSPQNPQAGRLRHAARLQVQPCGRVDTRPGPGWEGGMGRVTEVEGIGPEWRGYGGEAG